MKKQTDGVSPERRREIPPSARASTAAQSPERRRKARIAELQAAADRPGGLDAKTIDELRARVQSALRCRPLPSPGHDITQRLPERIRACWCVIANGLSAALYGLLSFAASIG